MFPVRRGGGLSSKRMLPTSPISSGKRDSTNLPPEEMTLNIKQMLLIRCFINLFLEVSAAQEAKGRELQIQGQARLLSKTLPINQPIRLAMWLRCMLPLFNS